MLDRVAGPVFVPAQPRRPVGKVTARRLAGRGMQGSDVMVPVGWCSRVSVAGLFSCLPF
jgi:hypothetical protein